MVHRPPFQRSHHVIFARITVTAHPIRAARSTCAGSPALIIAVIAVATYYFESDTNPVTGKKQHVAMNVDQEMRLGLDSAPQMAAEMGGAADPRDDPRARFVAEVGRRIVQESDARRSPYVGNFHFFLLNDPDTINAFALPGGQIFITRGLFDKLDDEAELAGVLGHEIGHVVNRHAAEHMATSRLGQLLTLAVGVGASDREHGRSAQMIAAMVNQMTQLKFTREDESEADRYGLRYMAAGGLRPIRHARRHEDPQGGEPGQPPARNPRPPTPFPKRGSRRSRRSWPTTTRPASPRDLTRGRSLRVQRDETIDSATMTRSHESLLDQTTTILLSRRFPVRPISIESIPLRMTAYHVRQFKRLVFRTLACQNKVRLKSAGILRLKRAGITRLMRAGIVLAQKEQVDFLHMRRREFSLSRRQSRFHSALRHVADPAGQG